jgi:hypothetical protein
MKKEHAKRRVPTQNGGTPLSPDLSGFHSDGTIQSQVGRLVGQISLAPVKVPLREIHRIDEKIDEKTPTKNLHQE